MTLILGIAASLAVLIGGAVGLLGGGGSILTTPLLVYVMGFDPKEAITASLLVVGVTSIFGLIGHARAGRVIWPMGLIFGAAGMVGAFVGGQIGSHLPGALLLTAFAVMMGVTAVAMIRGRRNVTSESHDSLPLMHIIGDGFVVGLVTGLVGAGGGFLVVPALALLGGLPMPNAVATSLLVVAMKSFSGFAGYALQFGVGGAVIGMNPDTHIDWKVTIVVTIAAVIGASITSRLVGRIHPDHLRTVFGWFVLCMAFFVLSQQLGSAVLEFAARGPREVLEVLGGAVAMVSLLTWTIRRPIKVSVADYDEPEIALQGPKPRKSWVISEQDLDDDANVG